MAQTDASILPYYLHPREVQLRLYDIIKKDHLGGWDNAWQEKVTPWDAGQFEPPLRDVLISGEIPFSKTGKALVPGCGKGYDAVLIASTFVGMDTTGLDISPTALAEAEELAKSSDLPAGTKVTFANDDFFTLDPAPGDRYDIVYDYTFFVAIPPSRRPEWGRQMNKLVKPGGYLITLVYPIADQPDGAGPPFRVRPDHYPPVLGEGWEKVLDKVPENSLPHHIGMEHLVVYKKL